MKELRIPRPIPGEYNPLFHDEIALVGDVPDFAAELRRQARATRGLWATFGERHAGLRYGAGKWTVREVLGHLSDDERILSYRALRIARGDQTVLAGFDENAYVPAAQFESRSLASVLGEFLAVRAATVALVEGLPPEAFSRRGQVGTSVATVAALLYLLAGHEVHHQHVVRSRYVPCLAGGTP
jgi:uncharacterized damage-inducible protein DinB